MYGTAWRILRSPQEAEEVVQEAFLALFRAGGEDPPRNLGAWLHRVTANRALDRVRRRSRRAEIELFDRLHTAAEATGAGGTGPRTDERAAAAASRGPTAHGVAVDAIDIERAIDSLPERARMVFILHDVEGFKHREVGELMGISDGSSKSQLFRARAMLRDRLARGPSR